LGFQDSFHHNPLAQIVLRLLPQLSRLTGISSAAIPGDDKVKPLIPNIIIHTTCGQRPPHRGFFQDFGSVKIMGHPGSAIIQSLISTIMTNY
jgi:hypothetical protein